MVRHVDGVLFLIELRIEPRRLTCPAWNPFLDRGHTRRRFLGPSSMSKLPSYPGLV
jgi:hypothetical protein